MEGHQIFHKAGPTREDVGPVAVLWELREPMRLLRGQRDDGSWAYPGKYPEKYPDVNYSLLETFKRLRLLVSKYGFNRSHRTIQVQLSYSSVGPEERRSLRD